MFNESGYCQMSGKDDCFIVVVAIQVMLYIYSDWHIIDNNSKFILENEISTKNVLTIKCFDSTNH